MFELTDLEKDKIVQFNQDEVLVEAVRKVMLASIYSNGTLRKGIKANPTINAAFSLVALASSGRGIVSNEDLGQDLRGVYQGVQLLENAFKKLSEIKVREDVVESPYNEAI